MKTVKLQVTVRKMGVDSHINGRGELKVVFGIDKVLVGQFNRDHINVFPREWKEGMHEVFFRQDRTGKTFIIEGELKQYCRKDGSTSFSITNVRPGK